MRERDVEAAFVERIEALGGETRKVKWIGRVAAPDRVAMLPGLREPGAFGPLHRVISYPATVWVELKATGEKPRLSQLREHKRMRALGQRVLVIDSLEAIDKHFPLEQKGT